FLRRFLEPSRRTCCSYRETMPSSFAPSRSANIGVGAAVIENAALRFEVVEPAAGGRPERDLAAAHAAQWGWDPPSNAWQSGSVTHSVVPPGEVTTFEGGASPVVPSGWIGDNTQVTAYVRVGYTDLAGEQRFWTYLYVTRRWRSVREELELDRRRERE